MSHSPAVLFSLLAITVLVLVSPIPLSAQEIPAGWVLIDDMILPAEALLTDAAWDATPWPASQVYYEFDVSVPALDQAKGLAAMEEIEAVCGASFILRTTEPNWVRLKTGSSNSSLVGMAGGAQDLTLVTWGSKFVIVHELMHALGFIHEHQRSDRNSFITVNWGVVQSAYWNNFNVVGAATNLGDYDFLSVMHYEEDAFNIGYNDTITCKSAFSIFQKQIGQRLYLSFDDAAGLAALYGPPERPQITSVTPGSATVGGSVTLTVNGSGFFAGSFNGYGIQGSRVLWAGTPLTTTWVSSTQLQATAYATQLATPRCVSICVENPVPGVKVSNYVTVAVGLPCSAPDYQLNTPEASLSFDGVEGSPYAATRVAKVAGDPVCLDVSSTLIGTPWDVVLTAGPPVPLSANGFMTSSGQVINVDILSPGLVFLNSGTAIGTFPSFTGNFSWCFSFPLPLEIMAQGVFLDPGHPDGLALSQPAWLVVAADACGAAVPVEGFLNDIAIRVDLGFPFHFYGHTYSDAWIGSNGHLTFEDGHGGWIISPSQMRSHHPRIAPLSDNLNPQAGGQVLFFTDPASLRFAVCWSGVPSAGTTNSNTFGLEATDGVGIVMSFPHLDETGGYVGLSPGDNFGSLRSLDLSAGPHTLNHDDVPYQAFSGNNDLQGSTLTWTLDARGFPDLGVLNQKEPVALRPLTREPLLERPASNSAVARRVPGDGTPAHSTADWRKRHFDTGDHPESRYASSPT